jgi:signal transduction histidine kinase
MMLVRAEATDGQRWVGGWLVTALAILVLVPTWSVEPFEPGVASWADVMISVSFVAALTIAAFIMWRRPDGRLLGAAVAAGLAVAVQALLVTLVTLTTRPSSDELAITSLVALGVAGTACVVGAITDAVTDEVASDDSYGVALGLGLVAQAALVLQFPIEAFRTPERVLLGVVLSTPVVAVAVVALRRTLRRELGALLVCTAAITVASVVMEMTRPSDADWLAALGVVRGTVGALWLGVGWVCLTRLFEEDRRHVDEVSRALAASREHRERMHELRSTVAGLVSGSEMLDYPEVRAETRARMWAAVRAELGRLQRMLADEEPPITDLDLRETLEVIREVQQLKGRQVEVLGAADTVRAHYDWLAEVVNILIDNAEVHGGSDTSRIEVLRRDGETVDIAVTDFGRGIPAEKRAEIFEWGTRGEHSPGDGIGLNLAQRLVARDGGVLQLSDEGSHGSTFVISLPAPRTSAECPRERRG